MIVPRKLDAYCARSGGDVRSTSGVTPAGAPLTNTCAPSGDELTASEPL